MSTFVVVTAVLLGGCLKSSKRVAPPGSQSRIFIPPASPDALVSDAVQTMSQLGARVIRNDDGSVRSVVLTDVPVNDAALAPLKDFPDLEVLSLSGTRITNSGMAHLTGLDRLSYLFMNDTEVTDQGLLALADSVALRYISLDNTNVTPQAVEQFRKLSPGTVVQHSPRQVTLEEAYLAIDQPSTISADKAFPEDTDENRFTSGNSDSNPKASFGAGVEDTNSGPGAAGVRLRYRGEKDSAPRKGSQ